MYLPHYNRLESAVRVEMWITTNAVPRVLVGSWTPSVSEYGAAHCVKKRSRIWMFTYIISITMKCSQAMILATIIQTHRLDAMYTFIETEIM